MANYVIELMGEERGSKITTSSSVLYLDDHSILLNGGTRLNISDKVGMIYDEETTDIVYVNADYVRKNASNPIVRKYLLSLRKGK